MTNYKLTKQDSYVIEFIKDSILPIANEVTNFYSHWTKADEEEHLQKAFLYECRQNNIKITREVAITQYYKDLAFTEKKLDFFIFPEQENMQLPTGVFIETKANYQDDTGQSKLDGRYQLFRYLYSSSHNPDENLSNAEYGLFLIWGQNYNHDQFKNLDTFSIIENKVDAYIELWKSTNKDRTKFAKIYQSKVVPISLKKLKKDDLLNLCKENGIKTSSNDNIEILISKLNEENIYEL